MKNSEYMYAVSQLRKDFGGNRLLSALAALPDRLGLENLLTRSLAGAALILAALYLPPCLDFLLGSAAAYEIAFLCYVAWHRHVLEKKYVACPACGRQVTALRCRKGDRLPSTVFWIRGLLLRHCPTCKSPVSKSGDGVVTACCGAGSSADNGDLRRLFRRSTRVIVLVDIDLPSRASLEGEGWKYLVELEGNAMYFRGPRTRSSRRFPCLLCAIKASRVYKTGSAGESTNEIDLDPEVIRHTRLLVVTAEVAHSFPGLGDRIRGVFKNRVTAFVEA